MTVPVFARLTVSQAIEQVEGAMRTDWRGTEAKLQERAAKRVVTAEKHLAEARRCRSQGTRKVDGSMPDWMVEARRHWLARALTFEVLAAVNLSAINRAERDAAFRLIVGGWSADVDSLLMTVQAVLR